MKIMDFLSKVWSDNQSGYAEILRRIKQVRGRAPVDAVAFSDASAEADIGEFEAALEADCIGESATTSEDSQIDNDVEDNAPEDELELPDFDEVRAPWMVRLYALQEEFDKIAAQNKELMQKNGESSKLLEQKKRLIDMIKRLDTKNQELSREVSHLRALHSDAEYQEMIENAMKYVYDAHSDAEKKKAELRELELKVDAVKKEYRDVIRKRAMQEELVLRVPRGKGALLKSYAELCGESLGEMIVRVVEESASKTASDAGVDKRETTG